MLSGANTRARHECEVLGTKNGTHCGIQQFWTQSSISDTDCWHCLVDASTTKDINRAIVGGCRENSRQSMRLFAFWSQISQLRINILEIHGVIIGMEKTTRRRPELLQSTRRRPELPQSTRLSQFYSKMSNDKIAYL